LGIERDGPLLRLPGGDPGIPDLHEGGQNLRTIEDGAGLSDEYVVRFGRDLLHSVDAGEDAERRPFTVRVDGGLDALTGHDRDWSRLHRIRLARGVSRAIGVAGLDAEHTRARFTFGLFPRRAWERANAALAALAAITANAARLAFRAVLVTPFGRVAFRRGSETADRPVARHRQDRRERQTMDDDIPPKLRTSNEARHGRAVCNERS
jgi:hypothetical protein